jgi:hypothetical protein
LRSTSAIRGREKDKENTQPFKKAIQQRDKSGPRSASPNYTSNQKAASDLE